MGKKVALPKELAAHFKARRELFAARWELREALSDKDPKRAEAAFARARDAAARDARLRVRLARPSESFWVPPGLPPEMVPTPPWPPHPPYGSPTAVERIGEICDLHEVRSINAADYWEDEGGGGSAVEQAEQKWASGTVAAGTPGDGPGIFSVTFVGHTEAKRDAGGDLGELKI